MSSGHHPASATGSHVELYLHAREGNLRLCMYQADSLENLGSVWPLSVPCTGALRVLLGAFQGLVYCRTWLPDSFGPLAFWLAG